MRKRYWVLLELMAFGALGNLFGGSDTPVTASVRESVAPSRPVVSAPALLPVAATPAGGAAPQFEASLFVTPNSLNLRESPSTAGRVLGTLARNSVVWVGERRGGWVNVSVDGVVGCSTHRIHKNCSFEEGLRSWGCNTSQPSAELLE